jgi:prophage DNA circulation protein
MTQKDFKVKNGIIASGNITSSNSGFIFNATANTLSVGGSTVAFASNVNSVQSNVATLTTGVNGIQANINSVQGNVASIVSGATALTNATLSGANTVFTSTRVFINNSPGGSEGAELHFAPSANGSLSGYVVMDIFENRIRFFESGGSNRGAYIDLASSGTGVGSNLSAGGSTGATVASVNLVQSNLSTLTTSVNTIKANVDSVQSNVTTLTTSVNTIKANVDSVQANVTNIINGTTAFTGVTTTFNKNVVVSGNVTIGTNTSNTLIIVGSIDLGVLT